MADQQPDPRIAEEQLALDGAYQHLDAAVARDRAALREVMLDDDHNPQARVHREVDYHRLQASLDRYQAAEVGLVFGRIDISDDDPDHPVPGEPGRDRRYIGRMGLTDPDADYRSVVLDWRAPGARPFYLATTARPEGVSLRRHVRTAGRRVTGVDDEWLSATTTPSEAASVSSEAVLREVLNQARHDHMQGIVETIQAEQDVIIRDATRGTMVVQGGPGTGKTAVALHRVAWLLYTYREQLSKTGVLIIGPNSTFLDYISQVLPSLGETGVVLRTIGQLYPGISGTREESLVAEEVKGSIDMVEILRRAVRAYQEVPPENISLLFDGVELHLTPQLLRAARTRARRSRKPHNQAAEIFRQRAIELLAAQAIEKIGADPLGGANLLSAADREDLALELENHEPLATELDQLWPQLSPQQVLIEFLGNRERIAEVAYDYDELTHEALYRADLAEVSASDVPLLDELAELLGPIEHAESPEEQQRRQQLIDDAQAALDVLTGSASQDLDDQFDAEILMAYDVIDAETLAQRHEEQDWRSTAERAAADRNWAYGHVIVDEAQELSAMAWRMVRRRCPNAWMTIVGDVTQTGSPAGTDSWSDALEPLIGSRWRQHDLTVNYRTPVEIMDVAAEVLAQISTEIKPPTSIRSVGFSPERHATVASAVAAVTARYEGSSNEQQRSVAIVVAGAGSELIADQEKQDNIFRDIPRDTPHLRFKTYTVDEAKGLEFDEVILIDPDQIVQSSPQGLQDLYVALTRATQGLTVVAKNQPEHLPELPLR